MSKREFATAASASSAETAITREVAAGIRPPREFDRRDGSVRVTDGRMERRLLYTAANDREVCELTLAHAYGGQIRSEAVTRWQSACFELQNVLADLTDAPLDCVGLVRRTDRTTADPTGAGDTADDPPSSAGSDKTVAAADVTVELHCRRGASSDDLPFDTTPYDFLTPARGRWILSRLSITNDSTARIQLDDDFRVRWYDEDGATLATTFWPEGYAPALTARGGQHVVRTGLGFEDSIRGMGGEQLPAELLDAIFGSAAGCELAAPPTFTTIDDDAFIAPELAGHVEITECVRDDEAGRWFVGYRITNPTDRTLRVQMTAELVDVDGNRLGMAGGTHPAVEPGDSVDAETPGYSVLYTIDRPARIDRCELFAVEIE